MCWMIRIGNIRRANSKKVKYGKGFDDLMPRAMKTPQPEDNILAHTAVSMQAKIKDGELNYYSNSISMDLYSEAIGVDNICTDCIFHTTEAFFDHWLTLSAVSKGFWEPYHHLSRKEPYSSNGMMTQEQNTSSLSLTPIMYHQSKSDFSVHNTGINPSGTSTEENQQEQMTSSSRGRWINRISKRVSRHLRGNTTASKSIPCIRTQY